MYYHEKRLQFPVRVERPDPLFARQLQQAIGGIEGEIRVCMQYFFQAWGARGVNAKYRDMLLHTATEELGHIEMLATAVAMNLQEAPVSAQETASVTSGVVGSIIGGGERPRHMLEGMLQRHILSTGMGAYPADSDGVPFDMSHVYSSGNIAADMFCNVAAEATGRTLATRLYESTKDGGMRAMLSFLIARDTMHQQQWLAVIDELGGLQRNLPIPNSFGQENEQKEYSYKFFTTHVNGEMPPEAPWNTGPSVDGKGKFELFQNMPFGHEPSLGPARPDSGAQTGQIS